MPSLIIFDLNRTVYDPDTDALVPGALAVLEKMRELGVGLVLISRDEPGRGGIVERFALAPYFREVRLVDEKTPELFADIIARYAQPQATIVVGDYPDDEIRCGNVCGAVTVRVRTGKFSALEAYGDARPQLEIERLIELIPIVERYRAGGV